MSAVQYPVHSDIFFYTDTIAYKAINSFKSQIIFTDIVTIQSKANIRKRKKLAHTQFHKTTTKFPQFVYSPKWCSTVWPQQCYIFFMNDSNVGAHYANYTFFEVNSLTHNTYVLSSYKSISTFLKKKKHIFTIE